MNQYPRWLVLKMPVVGGFRVSGDSIFRSRDFSCSVAFSLWRFPCPPKELIHLTRYNHETWETEKFCPCEITLNCIEFVGCEQKSQDSFQKTCFSCPVFLTDFDQ